MGEDDHEEQAQQEKEEQALEQEDEAQEQAGNAQKEVHAHKDVANCNIFKVEILSCSFFTGMEILYAYYGVSCANGNLRKNNQQRSTGYVMFFSNLPKK